MSRAQSLLFAAPLWLAVASVAAAAPLADPPAGASTSAGSRVLDGRLDVVFRPRPSSDGSGRWVEPLVRAPIVVELASVPTARDVDALTELGVEIARRGDGSPLSGADWLAGDAPRSAFAAVAALPRVRRVSLDGSPFPAPRPLDGTAELAEVSAVWRRGDAEEVPLDGEGVVVCGVDNGVDVFHPMFFRADGGFFDWNDVNGDGVFTPSVDAIDLDGDGTYSLLGLVNAPVTNFWSAAPVNGSDDPSYQVGMDWLFADDNANGVRDLGPGAGYTESDPTYGERLLVADDVNANGRLDVGEKLVALGTSKIRAFRLGNTVYRRGENLVDAPRDEEFQHGTGSSGVMVGGQRGHSRLVGMAPGAELVMATDTIGYRELQMTSFCIDEGARVVLHEYAPWVGYHLDGSSPLESLIDSSVGEGVSHINPAGNLSTSQKLFKRTVAAGAGTDVDIVVPQAGTFGVFVLSVLWRDVGRDLELVLEDPSGYSEVLTGHDGQYLAAWPGGLELIAFRDDSSRGTARVDAYLYGGGTLAGGTWKLHVTDPEAPGGDDLTLVAYVFDEVSGWGHGIYFPEDSSEEHLVGYPGTADHGLAVAAYTGHGWGGGVPGTRASYSGRGRRIDGYALMSIAAPDDPVTSGYWDSYGSSYIIYGGTSGASPHVAGTAALLVQADPSLGGDDVRDAIRGGAIVDDATGEVPNDDWGYGKLSAYRAIFGVAPEGGEPPTLVVSDATVSAGEEAFIDLVASDPDEPAEGLRYEVDREYDGVYEERLDAPRLSVLYDTVGQFRVSVRVTDATGRSARALAHITVEEAPPASGEPPGSPPTSLVATGGGGCSLRGPAARPSEGEEPQPVVPPSAVLLAAVGLFAHRRRRRREGGRA